MSAIYQDTLALEGSPLEGENPQPFFCQKNLAVAEGEGFPPEKRYSFGRETGFRVLPYRMQDRYGRKLQPITFKSIVMENAFLRAEFVPALGGRLWSLYDKRRGRDILYKNPVFRPANLAIRNAWFSGGVEWNIGRLGHSVHTCSPVFAGTFRDGGVEVLRFWEFERQTRLFWRVEFTLPEDSAVLFSYVRIENPDAESKPLYWWTNAAVPQTESVRVFSESEQVIYIMPGNSAVKTMGGGRLPVLPVLPGTDASYPFLSTYSNEYFFQNDAVCNDAVCAGKTLPWESAVYEDGYAYGEVSTAPLVYRKMFCWGNGRGGQRWQEFLSRPGEAYLELQAGLAPTQLHTADISGGGCVDWVQAFTSFDAEPAAAHQADYAAAATHVRSRLMNALPAPRLEQALQAARSRCTVTVDAADLLSLGSGWAALEARLHAKTPEPPPAPAAGFPPGLSFPAESIGEAEAPWAELLETGVLPYRQPAAGPGSFVSGAEWESLLEASPTRTGDWLSPYHLGVMAFERGDRGTAASQWEASRAQEENPWALRNLALSSQTLPEVLGYYRRAIACAGSAPEQSLLDEYIPLLIKAGETEAAAAELSRYAGFGGSSFSPESLSLPLLEAAAFLAMNSGDDALLDRIFAVENAHTREGNTTLADLWTEREIRRLASSGLPRSEAETRIRRELSEGNLEPPRAIDFRMYY